MAAMPKTRDLCRMIKEALIILSRVEAELCVCCLCMHTYGVLTHVQADTCAYMKLSNKMLVLKA